VITLKQTIRNEILKTRDELSTDDILSKSEAITKNIMTLDEYKNSESIFCFLSFRSEVETKMLLEDALKTKKVYVPYVNKEDDFMYPVRIYNLNDFDVNKFGIREPRGRFHLEGLIHRPALVDKLHQKEASPVDLAIVPGVAFDRKGYRIGYGKGYYDKFFNAFTVKSKIGMAFSLQIIESVPFKDHDIPVDMIVTENELIRRF